MIERICFYVVIRPIGSCSYGRHAKLCSEAVCALQGRDYWARFERFVKTLAWSSDDVYIVTGPLYVPQRTPQGYFMHHPMIGLSQTCLQLTSPREWCVVNSS